MIGCSISNSSVIAVFISGLQSGGLLLPFLSEWTNLVLEGPGIARLPVELPIGFRDRGRPHQAVRIEIFHRLRPFPVDDQLANPFGVDAGVDHEMGDVDIFGAEFARDRLGHRAQANFALANAANPGPPRMLAVAP